MANRLLRSIAVKIGAGLATGFSLTPATRQPRRDTSCSPFLTRIEDIESRVKRVEQAPPPKIGPTVEQIAALGTLVLSQSEDIAGLRETMLKIEQRNAEQAESFGQKVALVEQHVPAQIEATVNARMAELEQRLRGEFQDIHHQTVDAFVSAIENKVVNRIAALENSLVEQSQTIVSLREKSLTTDDNLQRLLCAVEKLCARAEAHAQIAVVAPEPDSPALRAVEPEPEPQPVLEPEPELETGLVFAFTGAARNYAPPHRAMKTAGIAILGLAFIGFRLFR